MNDLYIVFSMLIPASLDLVAKSKSLVEKRLIFESYFVSRLIEASEFFSEKQVCYLIRTYMKQDQTFAFFNYLVNHTMR
jgi:hypothetical protein